jgi:hypothetical protein
MSEIKHVGRVKATNKKVIVAYRTIPGDAHFCLVVPTENLPDAHHDAIINLVESSAGQESYEFAEALDRSQFPDGSKMLPTLHAAGRLIKVPTSSIEMIPSPGVAILLSELNQIIAEQRGVAVDELSLKPGISDSVEIQDVATVKDQPVVDETTTTDVVTTFETPEKEAKYYRSQADKLAKQAAEYRRKAKEAEELAMPKNTA